MGDDNEIRQLIRRESESFLERALKETKEVAAQYDFQQEFGKTRKNKSVLVIVATLATILVLGAASVIVTRIIQERTRSMPVDVRAFDDINLKDLLDTAKRNEADRERASSELAGFEEELRVGLEAADRDYRSSVEATEALGLPEGETAARIRAAQEAADATKRRLRAELEPKIRARRAEIAEIQQKIDQYDRKLSDQARRQQEVLAAERKVADEEKRRLVAGYEKRIADLEAARRQDALAMKAQREDLAAALTLKWNPIFNAPRDAELIGEGATRRVVAAPQPFPDYLRRSSILDSGTEARMLKGFDDFVYLSNRLRAVPYLNSVPPTLARMEDEVRNSVAAYREVLANSSRNLEDRDRSISELKTRSEAAERVLERYSWSVSEFVRQNPEGGYVLDPRDQNNVSVAINPAVPVGEGSLGYVFRTSERSIATLRFEFREGRLRARVLELAQGERLMPFDPILINLSAPAPLPPLQPAPVPPEQQAAPPPAPAPLRAPEPAAPAPQAPAAIPPPPPLEALPPAAAPQTAPTPAPAESTPSQPSAAEPAAAQSTQGGTP